MGVEPQLDARGGSPAHPREAVKVLPQSVDNSRMIDTHLDWPEMAKFGIAAALFLLLCARLLMRG